MQINILDLGSSSFHLLCARVLEDERIDRIADRRHMVRFGQHAFLTGGIDDADWRAGMHAIADLLAMAPASAVPVVAVATSVFRDSDNGAEFLDDVHHRFGVDVEQLSGETEAELSLLGALHGLSPDGRAIDEVAAVFDIGGGSIELAVGDRNHCLMKRSVPLGLLRVAARCLPSDGVLHHDGTRDIARLLREALEGHVADVMALKPSRLVFASGTARLVAKLTAAESLAWGVWRLARSAVADLVSLLEAKDPSTLIACGIPSDRAETIGVGAVAVRTMLDLLGASDAIVTRTGLREGVAVRAVDRLLRPT